MTPSAGLNYQTFFTKQSAMKLGTKILLNGYKKLKTPDAHKQPYKIMYHGPGSLDLILCSDMKWRHAGFNEGANFNADECEYLIDRWNQQDSLDTVNIEVIGG
jgi:hypothetical protein